MTKRTRQRSTWAAEQKAAEQKAASPPPATPGYAEYWGNAPHPAAKQDPNADDYKNGDTSSWAEDVHPPPYENSPHPAIPTTELDHPAQKRAAEEWAEKKAMKCLAISERMLGRTASVKSVERQAFSLMSLPDKEIDATLKRMGGGFLGMDDMGLMGDQSNNDMYYDLNLANDDGDEDDMDDMDMMGFGDEIIDDGMMGTDDFDDDDMMGMDDFDDIDEVDEYGPMAMYARQMKTMARTMKAMKNEITTLKGGKVKLSSDEMLAEMFRTAGDDEDDDDKGDDADDDKGDDADDDKGDDDKGDDDNGKKASARMLADMLRQAAEDKDEDEDEEEGGKEASLEVEFGLTASDEMAGEIQFDGGESQVTAGFDPMGVGSTPDADDALLAEVFGGHTASQVDQLRAARLVGDRNTSDALRPTAKVGPRAATQRPQPRKANQGAQHLGQLRVASGPSQNSVLEGMWDSSPDVTKHFS